MGHGLVEALCQNSPSGMAWDLERANEWLDEKDAGAGRGTVTTTHTYTVIEERGGYAFHIGSHRHTWLPR